MSISAIQGFETPRNSVKIILKNMKIMLQISLETTNRETFLIQSGFRLNLQLRIQSRILNGQCCYVDVFGFIANGQILKKLV